MGFFGQANTRGFLGRAKKRDSLDRETSTPTQANKAPPAVSESLQPVKLDDDGGSAGSNERSTEALIRTNGGTDIWTACKKGDLPYVRQTLRTFPELLHLRLQGRSPLYHACHCGHVKVVKVLLNAGCIDLDGTCYQSALTKEIRTLLKQNKRLNKQLNGNGDSSAALSLTSLGISPPPHGETRKENENVASSPWVDFFSLPPKFVEEKMSMTRKALMYHAKNFALDDGSDVFEEIRMEAIAEKKVDDKPMDDFFGIAQWFTPPKQARSVPSTIVTRQNGSVDAQKTESTCSVSIGAAKSNKSLRKAAASRAENSKSSEPNNPCEQGTEAVADSNAQSFSQEASAVQSGVDPRNMLVGLLAFKNTKPETKSQSRLKAGPIAVSIAQSQSQDSSLVQGVSIGSEKKRSGLFASRGAKLVEPKSPTQQIADVVALSIAQSPTQSTIQGSSFGRGKKHIGLFARANRNERHRRSPPVTNDDEVESLPKATSTRGVSSVGAAAIPFDKNTAEVSLPAMKPRSAKKLSSPQVNTPEKACMLARITSTPVVAAKGNVTRTPARVTVVKDASTPSTTQSASTEASINSAISSAAPPRAVTLDRNSKGLFAEVKKKARPPLSTSLEAVASTPNRGAVVEVASNAATTQPASPEAPVKSTFSSASLPPPPPSAATHNRNKKGLLSRIRKKTKPSSSTSLGDASCTPDRGTVVEVASTTATAQSASPEASAYSAGIYAPPPLQPRDRNKKGVFARIRKKARPAPSSSKNDASFGTADRDNVAVGAAVVAIGAAICPTKKEELPPSLQKEPPEPPAVETPEGCAQLSPQASPVEADCVEVSFEAFGLTAQDHIAEEELVHPSNANVLQSPQQRKAVSAAATASDIEAVPFKEPPIPPSILRKKLTSQLLGRNSLSATVTEQATTGDIATTGAAEAALSAATIASPTGAEIETPFAGYDIPEVDNEENNITSERSVNNEASDSGTDYSDSSSCSSFETDDASKAEDSTCETESTDSVESEDDEAAMLGEEEEDLSAGKVLVRTASELIFQAPKTMGMVKEEIWCMITGVDDHCT